MPWATQPASGLWLGGWGKGGRNHIPVWEELRGWGPYRELPKLFPQWSPSPLSLLHPSPGFQSREAPPPNSSVGFLLDPAPHPPPPQGRLPACLPASLPKLSPLAVATEGLAGVPGTTPQRPELRTVPVCLAGM